MEDEAIIPEGTAIEHEQDAESRIAAILDVEEASTNVEQAEGNVEQPVEETETPPESEEPIYEIDGEQLPLSEIRNRMMMRATFSQKTQELAEERKKYQEAQFDRHQLRTEALQGIEALKQQVSIEFRTMEHPDWEYLVENDPAEFQRQQFIWGKRKAAVQQILDVENHLKQQNAEYEAQQHQAALQEHKASFLEAYPEMADPTTAVAALHEMSAILQRFKFTPEEMNGIGDHRMIAVVYELLKHERAQKALPPVIAKMEQKPVVSQKNASSKATDAYAASKAKFNKSRSENDAIAALEQMFS